MILSNLEIHKALNEGRLVIDPEPSPRRPTIGEDCPYDTHSVDLKLHREISRPTGGPFAYDLSGEGSPAELFAKYSEKFTLGGMGTVTLEPNQFILAQTQERIELPIDKGSPYLSARIEGKSSRARCGILVHFTAPTIHPGFKGHLTLEMINLGPVKFVLSEGMYIAQLIIEQVHGELFENPSQFQNQASPEGLSES